MTAFGDWPSQRFSDIVATHAMRGITAAQPMERHMPQIFVLGERIPSLGWYYNPDEGFFIANPRWCLYCGDEANSIDHLFPQSWHRALDKAGIEQFRFLAGACRSCNSIASDRVFPTVGDRINYVQRRIRAKRKHLWLPAVPSRIRDVPTVGRGLLESNINSALRSIEIYTGAIEEGQELDRLMQRLDQLGLTRTCSCCGMLFVDLSKRRKIFCSKSCKENRSRPGTLMGYV